MKVCIIVEHDNHRMHPSFPHVLTAARSLGEEITAVVIGHQCQSVAEEVSKFEGVSSVLHIDNLCYEHHFSENLSLVIHDVLQNEEAFLMASTTFGKDLLPRCAALFDVAMLSDVTAILSADTFERPIYAGNAIETIQSLDTKKILTIRQTAFDASLVGHNQASIKQLQCVIPTEKTVFVSRQVNTSVRPELTQAKRIVSGGRALQSAENFKLIEALADTLGAAVGASRAAVDAGFISNDTQVGQTGKVVAPDLYVAIGISGAIQHVAGIKDAKVIVAINKDPEAPIFQIADYGLVGDLFVLVPELIEQLKQ